MNSYLTYFGKDHKERVNKAITHLQAGKGILLVDDENRENEGDLIFSAEKMSVKDMALMIRSCSGIVCLCLTPEKAGSLELTPMVTKIQAVIKLHLQSPLKQPPESLQAYPQQIGYIPFKPLSSLMPYQKTCPDRVTYSL